MKNSGPDADQYKQIKVKRDGAVDWVTLNRPERLNALTHTMFTELLGYFTKVAVDPACRVIVLTGSGKGFCAGLDIKEAMSGGDALRGADGVDTLEPQLFDLIPAMRGCPQPIIGLINGAAAGGGLGIALACDVRIASTEARLLTAFTQIGLSGCEMGVTYYLPRIVGMGIAAELMYTSRAVDAERALRIGLVSEVAAADALEAAGRAMAADMLRATPLGLRRTKEVFNLCLGLNDLDAVLRIEGATQGKLARLYQSEMIKQFTERK